MEEYAGGAIPFDDASAAVPELQRTVPFSNEAEQSVLGAIFIDKD